MATAAQRAWISRVREAAGQPSAPIPPSLRRSAVDVVRSAQESAATEGREYRGPTVIEAAAGRLTSFKSSTHRKNARTTALTQSGIRAGQNEPEAYVHATRTVYGAKSEQAKQAILIKRVYDAKKRAADEGRKYRGPTYTEAVYGRLSSTATREHRDSSRVEALIRSGMRSGQTRAQAAVEATKRVYGANSPQARQAQLTRNRELQKIRDDKKKDAKKHLVVPDVTTGSMFPSTYTGARFGGQVISISEIFKSGPWKIEKYEVEPLKKTIKEQNLQLTSMSSKIQTHTAQLNIYENRLNKYNIVDGKFVGTEKQYDQYKKDYQKYTNKLNQVNSECDAYNAKLEDYESKRTKLAGLERKAERAKYGGLAGKYEDLERKTAEQLKAEKAEFKEEHPRTVAQFEKLYDVIKKTSELQVVGPAPSGVGRVTKMADPMVTGLQLDEQSIDAVITLSKREGFKGIAQQTFAKPLKTAVMVGVGVVTPPVLKGVGTVAKTLGAGSKATIAGKGVMAGIGGLYVVGTGVKYTHAGTPYERGAVLGEAIFQEIIPLFAGGYIGTKAITAVPKAITYTTQRVKFVSNPFKTNVKRMFANESAMAKMSFGKTKKQQLEAAIKLQEKLKKGKLTSDEIKYLENKYGTKRLKTVEQKRLDQEQIRKAEAEEIKRKLATGEYKEVKIGTGAQQQIQLVKVVQKPLTKQSLKEVVKVKEQFDLKVDIKRKLKLEQDVKQRALIKAAEAKQKTKLKTKSQTLEEQRLASLQGLKTAQYQKEMQTLAELMPSFKRKVKTKSVPKSKVKSKLTTKQKQEQMAKQKLKASQSQKQLTSQGFAQKMISVVAVMQIFKTATSTKAIATTKPMVKAAQKEKQRMALLEIPALTYKQMISSISTITSVAKAITEAKPARKYIPPRVPKMPAVKKVKIILPITPPIKAPKKKKRKIRKTRKGKKGYTPYEIRSRIATLHDMFG